MINERGQTIRGLEERLEGIAVTDMIAMRIGPDMRMAVLGASFYLARRTRPRTLQDHMVHACIYRRLPIHDGATTSWPVRLSSKRMQPRR